MRHDSTAPGTPGSSLSPLTLSGGAVVLTLSLLAGCSADTTTILVCEPRCPAGFACTASGCIAPDAYLPPDLPPLTPTCSPKCAAPTPHCSPSGDCVPCLEDSHCAPGLVCQPLGASTVCVPGCESDGRCNPDGAAGPLHCCGGHCSDPSRDPDNCGGCGARCSASHATATCAAGRCQPGPCDRGFGDCNQDPADGCEANLQIDPLNCGVCSRGCQLPHASARCADGCYLAACEFGHADCNAKDDDGCEVDVLDDARNCGGCGLTCPAVPHGKDTCLAGTCRISSCDSGFADCDGLPGNGCEASISLDVLNCGGCGNACKPGLVCIHGGCTCKDCNLPHARSKCQNLVCALDTCLPGFDDCDGNPQNGCEVDVTHDAKNCGGCNVLCGGNTRYCVAGACSAEGPGDAVTYQIDVAHSGLQPGTLTLPLKRVWSANLGGGASYPLIVDDRVFLTAVDPNGNPWRTRLHARDAVTGDEVWPSVALAAQCGWSNAAYEGGQIFVVNCNGLVESFDAATGAAGWVAMMPKQWSFSSAPMPYEGILYLGGAGSGGTLYAVDEAQGAVLWTQTVANGDESSPAYGAGAVYVSYACDQAYAFEARKGTPLWHYSTGCEGGGGKTVAYADGQVFTRDFVGDLVIDGNTGKLVGTHTSSTIPALAPPRAFYVSNRTLTAYDLAQKKVLWTYAAEPVVSAPVLTDDLVFVGCSSGAVVALDQASGQVLWSDNVGTPILAPDEQNRGQPLTGLGIGGGMLVVPAGGSVFVYK